MNLICVMIFSLFVSRPALQDTVITVTDTTDTIISASLQDTNRTVNILQMQDSCSTEEDTLFVVPDSLKLKNTSFGTGEELVFEIRYGFIKAGRAVMSIPDMQTVKGRLCYHVVTTAESNKFISTFFKVRDRVETYIDAEGYFPWKFYKRIREGHYKSDKYVEYDQRKNIVIENKKDTLKVNPFVQGVLSSFYYTRLKNLKPGTYFDIDNYGDGKLYPLRVLVHKKETIKVPAGKFKCIVVEPVMRVEGIFKQKGKLKIWLTDDSMRIPVLMKSKALIGSVNVTLIKYKKAGSVRKK